MSVLLNVLIVLGTFIFTEMFAWWKHKYLLHGPLWFIHKSHHEPQEGKFEWNDLINIIYVIPAAGFIWYGAQNGHWLLYVGIGITLYGVIYMVFHDIIIHRRLKIRFKTSHNYLRRLIRAHKIHHKHQKRDNSEAFGFLFALKKYDKTLR